MGPLERAVRRVLNPFSTRVTMLVQGLGTRRALRTTSRKPVRQAPTAGQRPSRMRSQSSDDYVAVPMLIGSTVAAAHALLSDRRLVPVASDPPALLSAAEWPDGVVVDQRPFEGTVLAVGSPVMVWIKRAGGSAGVREPRRPRPDPQSGSDMRDATIIPGTR